MWTFTSWSTWGLASTVVRRSQKQDMLRSTTGTSRHSTLRRQSGATSRREAKGCVTRTKKITMAMRTWCKAMLRIHVKGRAKAMKVGEDCS